MADNKDPPPPLGDSEVLNVQYPPGNAIPEFDQPAKEDGKVPSFLTG
jgi:hypothetical protein